MKTISVEVDWLYNINGRTVQEAIDYLSTLSPTHELSYWQSSGDDQGVEISSQLEYRRPYTQEESAALIAHSKANRIKQYQDNIAYHERELMNYEGRGDTVSADAKRLRIKQLKDTFQTLQ